MAWVLAGAALVSLLVAVRNLLDPGAKESDLPTFVAVGLVFVFGFLAASLAARGPRWWRWWLPAAWIGMGIATLALAYKDSFGPELRHFGPMTLLWHAFLHVLIAPVELFLGFAVGFIDPRAPLYVLASIAVCILGAELIRRRLWPRENAVLTPSASRR